MMTKYKLATFGQYEWHLVNKIPLFLMKREISLGYFGSISNSLTYLKGKEVSI